MVLLVSRFYPDGTGNHIGVKDERSDKKFYEGNRIELEVRKESGGNLKSVWVRVVQNNPGNAKDQEQEFRVPYNSSEIRYDLYLMNNQGKTIETIRSEHRH